MAYSRDMWPRQQIRTHAGEAAIAPPAIVAWPRDTQELASIVRFCAERGVPLVPFGAGSGVCGGVQADARTVLIDVKRMSALYELDERRLVCRAGAGVIGQNLEDRLNARGFTFGHFPSSIYCSTLGGWLACRAAGQCSGRYGKIEDRVLAVSFVDGTGRIWRGERGGPNELLLPLSIGSEGVFGILTEAKLRIDPAPSERQFSSWLFEHTEDGLEAIRQIYQSGLRPAVARLYDPFDSMISRSFKSKADPKPQQEPASWDGPGLGMRALVRMLRRPGLLNQLVDALPDWTMGGAKLVLVWEDDPRIGRAEKQAAERICQALGAEDTGEGPARHWLAHRHAVGYRQSALLTAGAFVDTMEVASTWSRLWPMYRAVRRALSPKVFVMAHFSHAYPEGASIYFTFAGAAQSDDASLRLYDETWRAALAAAIEAGGTLSHHHGVGRLKKPMMRSEQGAAVDLVRALKRGFDPHAVMNPGVLIPEALPASEPEPPMLPNEPLAIDELSQILSVPAEMTLAAVEERARERSWTLGLGPAVDMEQSVRGWLAQGGPGRSSKDCDPVRQHIAGLDGIGPSGAKLRIRPAPRRAVGPDLIEALVTAQGGLGSVTRAHLVARTLVPEHCLAWSFDDAERAEQAASWICGRGVRPLRCRVEGETLYLLLAGDSARYEAALQVVEGLVQGLGGKPLAAQAFPQGYDSTRAPLDGELVRLLDQLAH
jgi:alkyldihydroxyacetonephosphate synthase